TRRRLTSRHEDADPHWAARPEHGARFDRRRDAREGAREEHAPRADPVPSHSAPPRTPPQRLLLHLAAGRASFLAPVTTTVRKTIECSGQESSHHEQVSGPRVARPRRQPGLPTDKFRP